MNYAENLHRYVLSLQMKRKIIEYGNRRILQ